MRFETKEQREELIKGFEEHATAIEIEKKQEKGLDPNYNCKVIVDHRSEFDSIERDEKGLILSCSGEIYVFYIRQPKFFDAVKILDGGEPGKVYGKCILAWDCMIDKKESSPEIFTDRIKLGYLTKMLQHIDALLGDQKKN